MALKESLIQLAGEFDRFSPGPSLRVWLFPPHLPSTDSVAKLLGRPQSYAFWISLPSDWLGDEKEAFTLVQVEGEAASGFLDLCARASFVLRRNRSVASWWEELIQKAAVLCEMAEYVVGPYIVYRNMKIDLRLGRALKEGRALLPENLRAILLAPPPWLLYTEIKSTASLSSRLCRLVADGDKQAPAAQPSTQAEPEFVFRKQGQLWRIKAFGEEGIFNDLVGLRYIAELIRFGSRRLTELEPDPKKARFRKTIPTPKEKGQPSKGRSLESGGLDWEEMEGLSSLEGQAEGIDEEARKNYRNRLQEIETDMAEAEKNCDQERLKHLQEERDWILSELTAKPSDPVKRRLLKRIEKNLEKAYQLLAQEGMPKTSDHFRTFISRRGGLYVYRPTPPISWNNLPNNLPQK